MLTCFWLRYRAVLMVGATVVCLMLAGCASKPVEISAEHYPALPKDEQAVYIIERMQRLPSHDASLGPETFREAEQRIVEIDQALHHYRDTHGWFAAAKLLAVVNPDRVLWNWCCEATLWEEAWNDPTLSEAIMIANRSRAERLRRDPPYYSLHSDVTRRFAKVVEENVVILQDIILAEGAKGDAAACRAVPVRTANRTLVDEYMNITAYTKLPTEFLQGCAPVDQDFAELLQNRQRAESIDFEVETEKFIAKAREKARAAVALCEQRGIPLPATINERLTTQVLFSYRRYGGYISREDVTVRGRPAEAYVAKQYASQEQNRVLNGVPISVEGTPLAAEALASTVCR